MFAMFVILAIVVVALFGFRTRIAALERRLGELEGRIRRHPDTATHELDAAIGRPQQTVAEPTIVEASEVMELVPAFEPIAVPKPAPDSAVVEGASDPGEPEVEGTSSGRSFEDLFGRTLPIWAGGVTLAIAGMLIVKYSIDLGLLSPLVRVVNGLLFGVGLILAAEVAMRRQAWMRDVRVRQALSGAGIATLYGSVLVAANLYHLVGPLPALVGMAAITLLAMFLSLRFGAPSALLGLVGGLAAPALVGSGQPDIPLLSTYLALAVGGLCLLSRSQRWAWLGVAALAGGFGWGGLLILGGHPGIADSLSIGAYLLLLGAVFPGVAIAGEGRTKLRIGGSILAAAQIAGLVAAGGFAPIHWGLFGLISIAIVWLSRRDEALSGLPPIGLAIALFLLAAWPHPAPGLFAMALGGMIVIYGLPGLLRLWGAFGSAIEAGQLAAIGVGSLLIALLHFHHSGASDAAFAALSLGAALIPGAAAALGVRRPGRLDDSRFSILTTASAFLVAGAAHFALPYWGVGPAISAIGLALLLISLRLGDIRVEWSSWCFAAFGIAVLAADWRSVGELLRLVGLDGEADPLRAALRWAICAAIAACFAWRARIANGRVVAEAVAVLLGYAAIAQIVPFAFLPVILGTLLLCAAIVAGKSETPLLLPAMSTLAAIIAGWAIYPLGLWSQAGLRSIAGQPFLFSALPDLEMAIMRLLLPAALVLSAVWRVRPRIGQRPTAAIAILAATTGGVALHILYKQLFAISSESAFVAAGLAERTLWEALLLAAAAAGWKFASREPALSRMAALLCGVAMSHFAWFSLTLHNPLWAGQAVGAVPLLNLLPLAYAVPLVGIGLLRRYEGGFSRRNEGMIASASMIVLVLLAWSLLRQAFHGSILTLPGVTDAEDILRSVLAIILAVAFLVTGIACGSRHWRIGSLILMLAAVGKVFLFDASGLEGLARILSFVALGFSLIGIGWLYSRYLNDDQRPAAR